MMMTDEEIVESFRRAKYPIKQIKILSELNATNSTNIVEILMSNNVPPEDIPEKQRLRPRVCAQCGAQYYGQSASKFCKECRAKRDYERACAKRRKMKQGKSDKPEKTPKPAKKCAMCGAVITAPKVRFCPACAKERQLQRNRDYFQEKRQEREAAKMRRLLP